MRHAAYLLTECATVAETNEMKAVVWRAVGGLPLKQREAITYWLDGWSHAEIAGEVGCTKRQSEDRVYKAKRALRKNLLS